MDALDSNTIGQLNYILSTLRQRREAPQTGENLGEAVNAKVVNTHLSVAIQRLMKFFELVRTERQVTETFIEMVINEMSHRTFQ